MLTQETYQHPQKFSSAHPSSPLNIALSIRNLNLHQHILPLHPHRINLHPPRSGARTTPVVTSNAHACHGHITAPSSIHPAPSGPCRCGQTFPIADNSPPHSPGKSAPPCHHSPSLGLPHLIHSRSLRHPAQPNPLTHVVLPQSNLSRCSCFSFCHSLRESASASVAVCSLLLPLLFFLSFPPGICFCFLPLPLLLPLLFFLSFPPGICFSAATLPIQP